MATSTPNKPRVIQNANEEQKNLTKQYNNHGQALASTPVVAQNMMADAKIVTTTKDKNDEKIDGSRKRLSTQQKNVGQHDQKGVDSNVDAAHERKRNTSIVEIESKQRTNIHVGEFQLNC